jgi:septum formation protein
VNPNFYADTFKALEVYERLLKENEADPAELVISGRSSCYKLQAMKAAKIIADTVVIFPPERDTAEGGKHEGEVSEILEKPISREDQASLIIEGKSDTD